MSLFKRIFVLAAPLALWAGQACAQSAPFGAAGLGAAGGASGAIGFIPSPAGSASAPAAPVASSVVTVPAGGLPGAAVPPAADPAAGAVPAASVSTMAGVVASTAPAGPIEPVIADVRVERASSFEAVVTWTTDEDADSVVSYGPFAVYGSTAADPSPLPQHTVMLQQLAPGMTYHFQVLSRDADGHVNASADQTFVTPPSSVVPPGINLAQGQQATASSAAAGSPANVVDGNQETGWTSLPADPQTLTVSLGGSYWIGGAVLQWEGGYARAYQLQVSQDGSTWTTVYTQSSGEGGTETPTFAPVQASYVQLYLTQRASGLGYSLSEFQALSAAPSGQASGAAGVQPAGASEDAQMRAPQRFLTPATQDGINDVAVFGPAAAEVTIVDLKGRQVFRASRTGGDIVWNCRDGEGRVLASGVYIARIKAADSRVVYQSFAIAK